jgi:23S rRNA-/tRNA-specific pseudouridylate synthase
VINVPIFTVDLAAGVRIVNVKGKPSERCFRHLSYSKERDTSLIACSPITGRNHQLRVHLQHLGFPIIGDVQYGGRSLSATGTVAIEDYPSVGFMTKAMLQEKTTERRALALTDADVASARRVCLCCRSAGKSGILDSFTPAQLLYKGHTIRLHALRYRLRVNLKKQNDLSTIAPIHVNFSVGLPEWASGEDLDTIDWVT